MCLRPGNMVPFNLNVLQLSCSRNDKFLKFDEGNMHERDIPPTVNRTFFVLTPTHTPCCFHSPNCQCFRFPPCWGWTTQHVSNMACSLPQWYQAKFCQHFRTTQTCALVRSFRRRCFIFGVERSFPGVCLHHAVLFAICVLDSRWRFRRAKLSIAINWKLLFSNIILERKKRGLDLLSHLNISWTTKII